MGLWKRQPGGFAKLWPSRLVRDLWRLLSLSAAVGVIAGLGAIAFFTALDLSKWFLLEYLAGYHPDAPGGEPPLLPSPDTPLRHWLLFLLPAAGGLLSGAIIFWLAPEAEGHGTDAAIDAYHNRAGAVRARVPFIKFIASAITIGSGGSGGREGPIAQIGSGMGSLLARWLKLGARERRILLAAGMGAGVGAIFRAPLAGALFAAEVLYQELDQEYEVIVPAVIASIVAYAIFAAKFGWTPLFENPGFRFENPLELIPYFILALIMAAGAVVFVRVFYGTRDAFERLRIPPHFKPALGGLVVGAVALVLPQAIGTGYGFAQHALFGDVAASTLLLASLARIVTTSMTIGSGGSGGVFGPAVVIGAGLGGGAGQILARLFPALHLEPGAFAIVGMAGFFAAAANTPISTIIMVSEMTGNYHLLVPSMWVCFIAYMLCKRYTLYEKQLPSRFDTPVHITDMMEAVLEHIPVAAALAAKGYEKPVTVHPNTDLHHLADLYQQYDYSCFPVVDDSGHPVAMVSGRALRAIIREEELDAFVVASDLSRPLLWVRPTDSLLRAVELMADSGEDELCVVEGGDHDLRVVGVLTRYDVISAYHRALAHDRHSDEASSTSHKTESANEAPAAPPPGH